jgi:Protein of unknown function (DUF664)
MATRVHRPAKTVSDPAELLLGLLDFYRSAVERKLDGLSDTELRTSRVPSGWTPLGLLKHLVYMERRWTVWGFLAEPVADPWGDDEPDHEGPWVVQPSETADGLVAAMWAGAARTREIASGRALSDVAAIGGRFGPGDALPTLGWTLHHVLQEYARHAGHLDIARELADEVTGE